MSLRLSLMAAAIASAVSAEPSFCNTALLLNGGSVNGAQNSAIVDSSPNALAVTRQGDAVQGSFSPFSPAGWSALFDGTCYYDFSASAGNFGAGDWTVEFWVNTASADGPGIVTQATAGGAVNTSWGFFIGYGTSRNVALYLSDGSAYFSSITPTAIVADGKWHHVAATRAGATVRLFVDGALAGSTNVGTTALGNGTLPVRVGGHGAAYLMPNGAVSNLRIVKGSALYTAAFTPSNGALTAVSGTSLLTCHNNRIRDNSSNCYTPTITGTPRIVPFGPFAPAAAWSAAAHGGSLYCDGAGDYASFTEQTLSGNFTLEAWIYPTNPSGTKSQCLFGGSSTNTQCNIDEYNYGGIGYYNNGVRFDLSGVRFNHFEWNHIAYVRDGSTVRLYINGVDSGASCTDNGIFKLSSVFGNTTYGLSLLGHGASVRASNTARYTANFTPLTGPFAADANTVLLLNFGNAGIVDATGRNNVITFGTAQVSTADKHHGFGSIYLDGTVGTFLGLPYSDLFNIGVGDYTAEFWVKLSAHGELVGAFGTASPYSGWLMSTNFSTTGKLTVFFAPQSGTFGTDTQTITSSESVPLNAWTHLAFTKQGNTIRLFINGVLDTTATLNMNGSTIVGRSNQQINIGADSNSTTNPGRRITGRLQGRITRGVARYTANFTPPLTFETQ